MRAKPIILGALLSLGMDASAQTVRHHSGHLKSMGRGVTITEPELDPDGGGTAIGTAGEGRGEQQRAVGSRGQDRLFGLRGNIPQLRLPHPEGVLFFAVIDLDLPSV